MKKSIKITLLVAASLVLVGCVTMCVALALGDVFEPENHPVTHRMEGEVNAILISTDEADVHVLPSPDGTCYAVCDESERVTYELSANKRGVVTLECNDDRRWYHVGINVGQKPTVTLYLPVENADSSYVDINILTKSGDIECTDKALTFATVGLSSMSGNIRFASTAQYAFSAHSESGDIAVSDVHTGTMMLSAASGKTHLSHVTTSRDISVESASGDISVTASAFGELTACAESGKVTLENVTVKGALAAETASGDVTLDLCDADTLTLTAASGDIRASLLSDKMFDVRTDSGRADYPSSVRDGGNCTVRTSSGDIDIHIAS